ncbi:glucosyltransferase domain-containing protein [Cohnella hashimotonis]|uniref:Glucosyltransferase domain-containing protein n=1 Tax=Cohnella hashimotonis TaxID=2826895 RepID=A0ABT6TWG7_9BACL|nr:glucosyltransferase domain-containing protein [Cohnella hashimotonis]MDI4650304.1 glucosyltransferase domain-containing protein [Cohnella hashimotonis]
MIKDGMEDLKDLKELFYSFLTYLKYNKITLVLIFFFSVLAYGIPLSQYTLSVDEEMAMFRDPHSSVIVWASQGRFGISFIKFFLNFENSNPLTSTYLAIFLLGFSSLLWAFVFKLYYSEIETKQDRKGIIVSLLFLTFPAYAQNIGFSMMSFELGIGWSVTALATLFLTQWVILKKNAVYLYLSIICTVFATAIYQAFLPAIICGAMAVTLLYLIRMYNNQVNAESKTLTALILKYAIVFSSSLLTYKLIDKIISVFIPPSDYISGFFNWNRQSPLVIIKHLVHHYLLYFSGKVIYGSLILIPTFMISILIVVVLIWRTVKYKATRRTSLALLIAFFGCVSTLFLMPVMLGIAQLIRMDLVSALFVAIIWILFYILLSKRGWVKPILLLVALYFAFYQSISISKLFYSDYLRYQDDVKLAVQIGDQIEETTGSYETDLPVAFIGQHKQAESMNIIKQEVLGFSLFEWDQGNPYRMNRFMGSLGYNYLLPSSEQTEIALKLSKDMPMWPQKGSVALKNNVIIVHLSEDQSVGKIQYFRNENNTVESNQVVYTMNWNSENSMSSFDVKSEEQNGKLSILSGDIDPQISFQLDRAYLSSEFKYVEFEITAQEKGDLQLFLAESKGQYTEENSTLISLNKGYNKIYCKLPLTFDNLSAIRFDPPAKSTVEFSSLQLVN